MPSDNATIPRGALVRQWQWPLHMAFWWTVIGAGVWGWTVGAHWLRATEGTDASGAQDAVIERLAATTKMDRQALDALASRPSAAVHPPAVAEAIFHGLHDNVIRVARGFCRSLMDWPARINAAAQGRTPPPDPGGQFLDERLADERDRPSQGWTVLVMGTWIFAMRTAMVVAAWPLLLSGAVLGGVDGLVARARRKSCAGRESASLYHRAKLGASFAAILGYLAWLAWPAPLAPVPVFVVVAVVLTLLLRTQAAFYKKYL